MSAIVDGNWRLTDIALQNRERALLAKKNRQAQLKKWTQYDKHADRDLPKNKKAAVLPGAKAEVDMVTSGVKSVTFGNNIVLLEAATREDYTEVRRLLSKGVSPDLCNEDGLTPLHQCSIDNSIEMCRLLLSFNANVNAKDSENWTPLHAASTCGHTELCKLLIDHNADLLSLNADGNMPYDICDHEMTLDLIEREMAARNITQQQIDETRLIPEKTMLKEMQQLAVINPAALKAQDSQGATPLHVAAANGFCEVIHFLCSKRVPVDPPDKDAWLPIHIAACWGHIDVIELLVSFGADIEARTKGGTGESIFDICEDGEMQERLRQIQRDQENLRRFPVRNHPTRGSSRNPRSSHCNSMYDSTNTIRERSSSLSASVRRTSFRDKSLTSWREAKQEAEIRLSKELEIQTLEGTVGAPIITPNPSTVEQQIPSPNVEMNTQSNSPTHQINDPQRNQNGSVKARPVANRAALNATENAQSINIVTYKSVQPEEVCITVDPLSKTSSLSPNQQPLNVKDDPQNKETPKWNGDHTDGVVKGRNSSPVKEQGRLDSKNSTLTQRHTPAMTGSPNLHDRTIQTRQAATLPTSSPTSHVINKTELQNRSSSPPPKVATLPPPRTSQNTLSKTKTATNTSPSSNRANLKVNSTKKCCRIL